MKAYIKFGELLSIYSQDIMMGGWNEGWNDGQPKSNIAPIFLKRGCKKIINYIN